MLLTQEQAARQEDDVQAKARALLTRGLKMVARLEAVGREHNSSGATEAAAKIRECLDRENVKAVRDMHNADGELFDSVVTLSKCRSRFCPFCSELVPWRDKRRALAVGSSFKVRASDRRYFVTLTAPKVKGAPLLLALSVFRRAWSLLRKRQLWRDSVRGGLLSYEWTHNEGAGFNVHIHLLAFGRLSEEALSHEWTAIIKRSWHKQGYGLEIQTPYELARVEVKNVSEDEMMNCAAYLCKSVSWDAVPDAQLVEAAEVRRWPRLFEVFGEARAPCPLITSNLSDGKRTLPQKTRKVRARQTLSDIVSPEERSRILQSTRERRLEYLSERYPCASFEDVAAAPNIPRAAFLEIGGMNFEKIAPALSGPDGGRASRPGADFTLKNRGVALNARK